MTFCSGSVFNTPDDKSVPAAAEATVAADPMSECDRHVDGCCGWEDPVIPGHVPQCDQGTLAQSSPSIAFLSSSPSLWSWVSSLTLGALWLG